MTKQKIKDDLEHEIEEIRKDEMFSPGFKKKKLITYSIRTILAIALYYYFWEYEWVRWSLIAYIPLNLIGLGLILGSGYFLNKKIEKTRAKVKDLE